MKHTFLLSISLIITFSFQSCKEDKKTTTEKEPITITKSSVREVDEKEAYITKYNAYIAVWNDVTSRVEQAYAVLQTTINNKTGKPQEEQDRYFIPSLIESRAIVMLSDMVDLKPEIEELDALAPDLISSYKELLKPLRQLSEYYKLQSYKDDNFEKGSELYFKVREPIKKFIASSDILGVRLQEIDIKLSTENLSGFKEQDLLLLYNRGMIVNSLKQHSIPLYSIKYDEYQNLDLNAYDKHLEDIITYYTVFKSLATDKDRVKREMNIGDQAPFTNYYQTIDAYVKEARNLKEMILDTKKYNAMKSKVKTIGVQYAQTSHVKVTAAGERVIGSSNDLNQ